MLLNEKIEVGIINNYQFVFLLHHQFTHTLYDDNDIVNFYVDVGPEIILINIALVAQLSQIKILIHKLYYVQSQHTNGCHNINM